MTNTLFVIYKAVCLPFSFRSELRMRHVHVTLVMATESAFLIERNMPLCQFNVRTAILRQRIEFFSLYLNACDT